MCERIYIGVRHTCLRDPAKVQHKAVSMLYGKQSVQRSQTEMHTEDATAISVSIAYRSRRCSIAGRTICSSRNQRAPIRSGPVGLAIAFALQCRLSRTSRFGSQPLTATWRSCPTHSDNFKLRHTALGYSLAMRNSFWTCLPFQLGSSKLAILLHTSQM